MKPLSVLVVHPAQALADRIADAIADAGHDVAVVPDGERAIDLFVQQPFDAVVVEMLLPGRDGGATIESLRWAPGGDQVGFVLTGTLGTAPDYLATIGERLGVAEVLAGTLDPRAIIEALPRAVFGGAAPAIYDPDRFTQDHGVATGATTMPGARTNRAPRRPRRPQGPAAPGPAATEMPRASPADPAGAERPASSMPPPSPQKPTSFAPTRHDRPPSSELVPAAVKPAAPRARTPTAGPTPRSFADRGADDELLTDVESHGGVWATQGGVHLGPPPSRGSAKPSGGSARGAAPVARGSAHEPVPLADGRLQTGPAPAVAGPHTGSDPLALGRDPEGDGVERQAAILDQSEDVLDGDLLHTPFPRLLHRIAEARSTGALLLSAPADERPTTTGESPKKLVFFRNGVPVLVESNLLHECLGQALARGGVISPEALSESVRRMRTGEGQQGTVLVAMGAITPHQLRDALEEQLRFKLFDLFAWPTGSFRFSPRIKPPPAAVMIEISLPEIVYRGIVHKVAGQRLLLLLQPHLDRFVVPDRDQLLRFLRATTLLREKNVVRALDGQRRLREILALGGKRPGAVAQLLYALECLGAVAFRDEAVPMIPTELATMSRLAAGGDESSDCPPEEAAQRAPNIPALREELTILLRKLRQGHYAEALGVPPAEPALARDAAQALLSRFSAIKEEGAAPREVRALAFEVCARIIHAQRILFGARTEIEDGARSAANGEPGLTPSSWPIEDLPRRPLPTDMPQLADRDRGEHRPATASQTAPPAAPIRVIPGHGRSSEPDGEAPPDPQPTRLEPSARRQPASAAEPARGHAGPGSSSVAGRSDANSPGGLDRQVERMYQAEHHFRRGERAHARGRAREALVAFDRAVSLCPSEGEFVAHLGYARYQAGGDDAAEAARAAEELAEGCRLAPRLDLTHLLHARVLLHRGDLAAARDAYEQALRANPSCQEALRELRSLHGRSV